MDIEIPQINIAEYEQKILAIQNSMQDPANSSKYELLGKLNSELKHLEQVISQWNSLQTKLKQFSQNEELLLDKELQAIATEENNQLKQDIRTLVADLNDLTQPKLEHDDSNAIIEIRAGTGGTEASLFASEIYRMYIRYISALSLDVEQLSTSYSEEGGIKEAVFLAKGKDAFGKLRFESGVHRVQRVPSTESSGRIHTSTISVVVMPEIKAGEVQIQDSELRIETFRSSGPGGQSVNTTDSAVRITHIPTGITVSCQDGKSQHKNKDKALSILTSKLYSLQAAEKQEFANDIRSDSIRGGDRSAKIRTYNFPQGRITDHRIKETWYNLPQVMEGEIDQIVKTTNQELRKDLSKLEVQEDDNN